MTPIKAAPAFRPQVTKHPKSGSHLRIATYNVLFSTTPAQTKADLSRLMEHNGGINLQEFEPPHGQLFDWLKSKGWGHFHAPHTGEPVIWDKSKYSLVDASSKKLNDTQKNMFDTHRTYPAHRATWVRLRDKKTGKVFTTVSVHTIAHNRGPKQTPRIDRIERHQFKELAELTERLSKHGPVIIGGDLNADPKHKLTWPGQILKSAHLRSNWQWLGEKGVGKGTHGSHFIDNFLTLTTMKDELKLLQHHIVYGLHSDHNAVVGDYWLD